MRTLTLLLGLAVASVGCGDDSSPTDSGIDPVAAPGTDAGSPAGSQGRPDAGLDAGVGPGIDAGGGGTRGDAALDLDATNAPVTPAPADAANGAADAAPVRTPDAAAPIADGAVVDGGTWQCPPAIELRSPDILVQKVERALEEQKGGALVDGTYFLTKVELVINPAASESEKQDCRDETTSPTRESLKIVAASSTSGAVIARARDDDGEEGVSDYVSRNKYTVEGAALVIKPDGVACETRVTRSADGGTEQEVEVIRPDNEDDPTTFTATANTIALYELWAGDGDIPSCTYVSTYEK